MLDKRASDAPAPERAYAIFPHVLDANIDALNYEVGRTGPDDLKPLADNNWDKPFVAGVIDVKSTVTESADEVADRIRQVLEYVPADRLGLSTDCGLINLPRMIAAGKLRALADGAAIVRAETAGASRAAGPRTASRGPRRCAGRGPVIVPRSARSTNRRNLVLPGQRNSRRRRAYGATTP